MMLWAKLSCVLLLASPSGGGAGKVFLSPEEALALAFPECTLERGLEVLSEAERERAEELAGARLSSRTVRPYRALHEGKTMGTAYFDAHRVRSKNEVLMLVVGPDGRVTRLEVLAFAEPLEYLPKAAFYAQFVGKSLDAELELDHGIRRVAGATLSARAATEAARRVLAVHRVLAERSLPEPSPGSRAVPAAGPR